MVRPTGRALGIVLFGRNFDVISFDHLALTGSPPWLLGRRSRLYCMKLNAGTYRVQKRRANAGYEQQKSDRIREKPRREQQRT